MKKTLALVMALVMAMLTFAGCGKEKAAEELVFGTNAEFPPFEFVASKGVIGEFDGIVGPVGGVSDGVQGLLPDGQQHGPHPGLAVEPEVL